MFFMLWAMALGPYSMVEEYWAGAVLRMSAPFSASLPVCPKESSMAVHLGESFQGVLFLPLVLNVGEQTVGLKISY